MSDECAACFCSTPSSDYGDYCTKHVALEDADAIARRAELRADQGGA